MKKFTYIIATLCVVAISTAIFIGCEKEIDKVNDVNNKIIQKDNPIVNPFDEAGIIHNACMDTILNHPDKFTMSDSERFDIVQFCLSSRMGNDFVQISRANYQNNTDAACTYVDNNNTVQTIIALGESGKLDTAFSSQYITRNNYTILHELFSYIDNYTCNSENDLLAIYNLAVDYEQEILSNYYSLIDNGIIVSETQALYSEYKTTLMCMSVCKYSALWWYTNAYYLVVIKPNLPFEEMFESQCIDWEATTNAMEAGYTSEESYQHGTESSNRTLAYRYLNQF